MSPVKLTRSESDRIIAGVCGGLGEYLGIDAVFVRIAFVLLGFASGVGIPLYIMLMILVPGEANLGQPTSKIVRDNLDSLGENLSSGLDRARQESSGRNVGAILLIIVGCYLLLEQIGWIGGEFFWPLLLIGLGLFLIIRRSREG